ncbi:MAG TPA: BamA/TamA family outer membrane protein [Longimicrobiales bacterium]|nr:BamA/TamA family outer membrane protein [Longimicrobiales bacterium]
MIVRRVAPRLLPAVLALVALGSGSPAIAQAPPPPDGSAATVTVIPSAQYEKGSLYQAFMGSGWRDLWTTPITVPVADLSTLAGGLTPVRLGGGTTTQTLHLDGADGRRYVFRSVDKVPQDLLEDFAGTPLEAILQDQVASFHPSGAMVVAELLDAVGVLHPEPRLMVVPDDPRLGEFREQFAGMLVLYEERPDDLPDGEAGFAGSVQIVQTDDLFEILEEEPFNRVAARELLRARLVDLVVGDRDRSTNNFLWARFEDPDGWPVWRVVPRDRDQAFVQYDGFLKVLARLHDYRLVPFSEEYPSVRGLTRNAWDIDRTLLVGLTREEWEATVTEVQGLLTDGVIDRAVRRLPPEHHDLVGPELARALVERRDALAEPAAELYRFVFEYADIHVTDEDEEATVERRPDGSVDVTVRSVEQYARVTFQRTFSPRETREIRLYMHGGDDVVNVTGSGPGDIRLRAVGGGSSDRFVDRSDAPRGVNEFYDDGDATEVVEGPGTRHHERDVPRRFSWRNDEHHLDWGTEWRPMPAGGYGPDRGLMIGAAVTVDRFGFRKDPYSSRMRIEAGWSFGLSEPLVDYRHWFRDALLGQDLTIHARWSGLEIIEFYGLGNETPQSASTSFYRVPHKQIVLSTSIESGDGERRRIGIGPVLKYMSTDTTDTSHYLGTVDPYGSGRFWQVGLQAEVLLDGRDRGGTPSSGYHFEGGGAYVPALMDVDQGAFGEVHGQAAAYLSPPGGNPTLAVRAQAKKVWGTFPFAEAAFLGGPTSVRGVREDRYAGHASLLGSAEVRLDIARLLFLVPTDFGVMAFADAGRVYAHGESSDTWRTGWGGGLWFAPLSRGTILHLTVARSDERTSFYAGIGFAF